MGEIKKLLLLVGLAACAAAGTGCGGSEATGTIVKQERLYPWLKGPSREFLIRGGDNAVQTFGREGSKAEREQASEVIQGWMKARAAQNWKKDCSYFARAYIHELVDEDATKVTHGRVKTCPQALAYFGHLASGSNYKNNLSGPIDSLRVEEGHGYAQYHGNDGHDWVVGVFREHGRWLVSGAAPLGRSR
jgi:hypothetical protein